MTSLPLTEAGPVINWLCRILSNAGLSEPVAIAVASASLFSLALLLCWALYTILVKVVSPIVTKIVERTTVSWDDILFNPRMLKAWSLLVVSITFRLTIPMSLEVYPSLYDITVLTSGILIVACGVDLVNCFLMASYDLVISATSMRIGSLKGIRQMLQIIAFSVAGIIIIAMLINRSPLIILSGLGASAAVLMLVFKDSLLGLVAGVQLTLNDMLRPGDWISAPKHGVNGTVMEVTLTTVKVRNFDMTIVTVPPYSLVSESFQNWRGMRESGGRRVMRSISIDLDSIRFMTAEEAGTLSSEPWVGPEVKALLTGDEPAPNITIFRHYLEWYIGQLTTTIRDNASLVYMVRELQPTPQGLPVEIYFFTSRQEWTSYEHLQADVIDHILASVGRFALRTYQSPSGHDIRSLRAL